MIILLNKSLSFTHNHQRQSGAVLAISLIMLLLLTLIGITAAQVTGLEEKMAGNLRDRNLAFQAAETALRAGEEKTSDLLCPILAQVGGQFPYTDSPKIDDGDGSVWSTSSVYNYAGDVLANTSGTAQPKYIIQCLPSPPNSNNGTSPFYFRITARGTGGTTDAVVILQSVYVRN